MNKPNEKLDSKPAQTKPKRSLMKTSKKPEGKVDEKSSEEALMSLRAH